ncbi:hypothetical protein Leryth_000607 [Lithospermum erythrorhizon]|nr:hypothetical protein Leryth_000607 [Lithospermum erythrorhizon]
MSSNITICFVILLVIYSIPYPSFSSFLAPIVKDHTKHHHTLKLSLQNPPQPKQLLLDLGGTLSWVDCTTTSHFITCNSSICHALSSSQGPICTSNNCNIQSTNSLTKKPFVVKVLVDSLELPLTDGRNPGQLKEVNEFVLSCSDRGILKKLPKNAAGLAGLSRSNLSLMAQVSKRFALPKVFALCLSGSVSAQGVGFFGTRGPYFFLPEIDLSKYLNYTPLLSISSNQYLINVTSIKVNGKSLQLNQTSLTVDQNGAQLSTTSPYTVLHTEIFEALIDLFERESAVLDLTIRPPVEPFGLCYNADDLLMTRTGPAVPTVDLVLGHDDVFWRIFGVNSMVRILRRDVDAWCLGFVDGGDEPTYSIVIGGHQMEDNLLQFDLQTQRLGFTSSVLVHNTMCANFNFTTNINVS